MWIGFGRRSRNVTQSNVNKTLKHWTQTSDCINVDFHQQWWLFNNGENNSHDSTLFTSFFAFNIFVLYIFGGNLYIYIHCFHYLSWISVLLNVLTLTEHWYVPTQVGSNSSDSSGDAEVSNIHACYSMLMSWSQSCIR